MQELLFSMGLVQVKVPAVRPLNTSVSQPFRSRCWTVSGLPSHYTKHADFKLPPFRTVRFA